MNLETMISLIANNDPMEVYKDLLENNEEFRGFINKNKGVSTKEMIERYSIDHIIRETYNHAS